MLEKLKFLVMEICKGNNDHPSVEILENSELIDQRFTGRSYWSPEECRITFKTQPSVYVKHINDINRIIDVLVHYFQKVSDENEVNITNIYIKTDYDKINILNSNISIVQTPWQEINSLQEEIIESMKKSSTTIDFQNIGNSARTIMDKLARIVFNPDVHKAPKEVKLNNGNFKNQLHTYIKTNLEGGANKELRNYSLTAIEFAEKSIDLMNQTTHKLDVQKHFAEVCVISTISIISLIKAINDI